MILVLLLVAWMGLWGTADLGTALLGLVVGGLSTALVGQLYGRRPWRRRRPSLRRWFHLLLLGGVFLLELVRSTLSVTKEVLRPKLRIRPAIIAVPLDVTSDVQITVLANLISLTPGTLSLEVSTDRRTLFVHVLTDEDDGVQARRAIKKRLERFVLRAL